VRTFRRAVSEAWWAALSALGLPRDRWNGLPLVARRAVTASVWVAIGLVLVALFGSWKASALGIAGFVLLLTVPPWPRLQIGPVRLGRWVLPAAILGAAITYPYYLSSMPQLPIFGPFPSMNSMVVMMIFTMMALGLNVVVGYAGLLDLGYVAFYAMGAYMTGWFASSQFAKEKVNFGAIGVAKGTIGFHISIWLILLMAGIATATRPVEPIMSARLNDSVDSAEARTLNAPRTIPAPTAPETSPTIVAPPGPRPKLCRPKSPPIPNMATNPSKTGVGDTPPRSNPR